MKFFIQVVFAFYMMYNKNITKTANQSDFSATNSVKGVRWQKGETSMIEFGKDFEKQCELYLAYLYEQAEYSYSQPSVFSLRDLKSSMIIITEA